MEDSHKPPIEATKPVSEGSSCQRQTTREIHRNSETTGEVKSHDIINEPEVSGNRNPKSDGSADGFLRSGKDRAPSQFFNPLATGLQPNNSGGHSPATHSGGEGSTSSRHSTGRTENVKRREHAKCLKLRAPARGQRFSPPSHMPVKTLENSSIGPEKAEMPSNDAKNDDEASRVTDPIERQNSTRNPSQQQPLSKEEAGSFPDGGQTTGGRASADVKDSQAVRDETIEIDSRDLSSPPVIAEVQDSDRNIGHPVQGEYSQTMYREELPKPVKDVSTNRPAVMTSNRQGTGALLHKISSEGGPCKVTKPLIHRASKSTAKPAGMPPAGTRDIMHMLQVKLQQDERQALQAFERTKYDSMQQVQSLEHAHSITQSKLEVLESEKQRLLAKAKHDSEQIQSLRKRSLVLENFVNGFSSDFNRLKEDVVKAQNTCKQLREDKSRQDSEIAQLVEQFNVNLAKSETAHSEAKELIAVLQARIDNISKEKAMLESTLSDKVGTLAEQRDLCANLQRHLEEVTKMSGKLEEAVLNNGQANLEKLENLRVCVEHIDIDEKTKAMVAECAEHIQSLAKIEAPPALDVGKIQSVIEVLSSRQVCF